MSLVAFHRGLIAAAILFCFGYGLWELLRGAGAPLVGVLFLALGAGLAYYLSRLERFLGYRTKRTEGGRGESGSGS